MYFNLHPAKPTSTLQALFVYFLINVTVIKILSFWKPHFSHHSFLYILGDLDCLFEHFMNISHFQIDLDRNVNKIGHSFSSVIHEKKFP